MNKKFPLRRWYQFSLRTMFVGVAAIAILLAQWPPYRVETIGSSGDLRYRQVVLWNAGFFATASAEMVVIGAWLITHLTNRRR
jgi:hypothetical protein